MRVLMLIFTSWYYFSLSAQFVGDFMPWEFKEEIREILNKGRSKGYKYIEFSSHTPEGYGDNIRVVHNELKYHVTSDSTLELISYNNREGYCVCYHAKLKSHWGIYGAVHYKGIIPKDIERCLKVIDANGEIIETNVQFIKRMKSDTVIVQKVLYNQHFDRYDTLNTYYFNSKHELLRSYQGNTIYTYHSGKRLAETYIDTDSCYSFIHQKQHKFKKYKKTSQGYHYRVKTVDTSNSEYCKSETENKKYHYCYDALLSLNDEELPVEIKIIKSNDVDKPEAAILKVKYSNVAP